MVLGKGWGRRLSTVFTVETRILCSSKWEYILSLHTGACVCVCVRACVRACLLVCHRLDVIKNEPRDECKRR